MKQVLQSLCCLLATVCLSAQTIYFQEDFESGGSPHWSDPPVGWTHNIIAVSDINDSELWRFNNPQNRAIPAPVTGQFAIFDSRVIPFNGIPDDSAIESPSFAVPTLPTGGTPKVVLGFYQHYHRMIGRAFGFWTKGFVEVFDGTDWVEVYSTPDEHIGYSQNDLANHVSYQTVDITDVVAANPTAVQVRFRFTADGFGWWAIDQVQVYTPTAIDIGVRNILPPPATPFHCYSAQENVQVELENAGTATIDFQQHPITVQLATTGIKANTYTKVVNTGSLTTGQTQTVDFDQTDLGEFGTYVVNASATTVEDIHLFNNLKRLPQLLTHETIYTLPLDTVTFQFSSTAHKSWHHDFTRITVLPEDYSQPVGNTSGESNRGLEGWLHGVGLVDSIISPKFIAPAQFAFSFDMALVYLEDPVTPVEQFRQLKEGDKIEVVVSKDCGQSFEVVHTFDDTYPISTHVQSEEVQITGYAGEMISVGIRIVQAQELDLYEEAIYFYLDDLLIRPTFQHDIALLSAPDFLIGELTDYDTDMLAATGFDCGITNHPIRLQVRNHGSETQQNIRIKATVEPALAAPQQFTQLIESLAPQESQLIEVGTINTTAGSLYTLRAEAELEQDMEQGNNKLNAFIIHQTVADAPLFYQPTTTPQTIQFHTPFPNAQYLWEFGDGDTSQLQSPLHTYATEGTYEAQLTVTNDCGVATTGRTINIVTTGISEQKQEPQIQITPNPNQGQFQVQLNAPIGQQWQGKNMEITVVDIKGKVVVQQEQVISAHKTQINIDLKQAAKGIYFVKTVVNQWSSYQKILVQ